MSLDMGGFIDDVFVSVPARQVNATEGDYVDGIWVPGSETTTLYTVNVQPLSTRDIDNLRIAGERILDYRKIYVNDGDYHELNPKAFWEMNVNNRGVERYKVIQSDVREWRRYAKIIVCLIDGEPND